MRDCTIGCAAVAQAGRMYALLALNTSKHGRTYRAEVAGSCAKTNHFSHLRRGPDMQLFSACFWCHHVVSTCEGIGSSMSSIGAGSSPERHKSSEYCALVLPASKSACACIRQQALSTYIAYMDRPYSRASALHRLVARVLSCRAHNVRRQSYRPRDLESKPSERKCCLQACDGAWQARHRGTA